MGSKTWGTPRHITDHHDDARGMTLQVVWGKHNGGWYITWDGGPAQICMGRFSVSRMGWDHGVHCEMVSRQLRRVLPELRATKRKLRTAQRKLEAGDE